MTYTALITGASRGLGLSLAGSLARDGWQLIIDGRDGERLEAAAGKLGQLTRVTTVTGDVADPAHREALAKTAGDSLDLLVNNASTLGATPLPRLDAYPVGALEWVFAVNAIAPAALIQRLLPSLRRSGLLGGSARGGAILNITSDAAVEGYEGWAGYGASKAALEQLSNVLAAEEPGVAVWWADPGEMRTQMLAEAMPGEDISGEASPDDVAPALLRLIADNAPSGRYRAADLRSPVSAR